MTYEKLKEEAGFDDNTVGKVWYSDITRPNLEAVRNDNCVYMLECDGEIVYIGSSTNIIHRLETHKYKLNFDCVYIGSMDTFRSMLFMESYLIGIAEPALNFSDYTSKNFKSKSFNHIIKNINYCLA